MFWVHATLVETSLTVYHRFVRRLGLEEQEAYYREMALVARLFGTPSKVIPPTLAAFREYLRDELASPRICVTTPARDVAEVILHAPLPAPMRLILPAHRLSTAALLPPRLRAEYELRWDPGRALALQAAALVDQVRGRPALPRGRAALGARVRVGPLSPLATVAAPSLLEAAQRAQEVQLT